MKNLILLICLFYSPFLFGQLTIVKCDSLFCKYFELGKTKIGCLKVKKSNSSRKIYDKNFKNFKRHSINVSIIKDHLDLEFLNSRVKKKQKRKYLRSFIREYSCIFNNIDSLFTELELEKALRNQREIRHKLEGIKGEHYALKYLLHEYKNHIQKEEQSPDYSVYIGGLKENQKSIAARLNYLLNRDYCSYTDPLLSPKLIKGINIYHDNDFFNPLINNEDYNYTGGGRIEVQTDYLNMGFLLHLFPRYNKKILSYQGVFFGVEAFTPFYNHDEHITEQERDLLYQKDRPFGSYQYLGRTKYRLHYDGLWRAKSTLRIGIIGGTIGRIVQAVLHKDQTPSSIKVIGWDKQIANGGRLAWNADYELNLMLFSTTNNRDIIDLLKKKQSSNVFSNKDRLQGVNLYAISNIYAGNYLTAFDIGLGISGLGFKEQDGNNNISLKPHQKCNVNWFLNLKYRRVIHNTMLEGFGLFNTYDDDPRDDEPISHYQLESSEVNRNVFFADFGVSFRINKTTVFGKYVFHTNEFKMDRNPFYGWGTLGAAFLVN